jgi:hypothetical protein
MLSDEREGILQTMHHYFADTLSSIRERRVLARLRLQVSKTALSLTYSN